MAKSLFKIENLPFVRMGDMNEKKITPFIHERFSKDMECITSSKNLTHFKTIDYKHKITGDRVEVKSRSCMFDDYDDTMVGDNKVLEFKKLTAEGKRCWFIFIFTDGSYEWEYTTENYNKNVEDQRARGKEAVRTANSNYKKPTDTYTTFNPEKPHLYIMGDNLTWICGVCAEIPNGVVVSKSYKTYQPYKPQSCLQAGVCYLKLPVK
jgi:hypothetical protein